MRDIRWTRHIMELSAVTHTWGKVPRQTPSSSIHGPCGLVGKTITGPTTLTRLLVDSNIAEFEFPILRTPSING